MREPRSVRRGKSRMQRAGRKDHRRGGQQGWSRHGGRSLCSAEQQVVSPPHPRDHLQAFVKEASPPVRGVGWEND